MTCEGILREIEGERNSLKLPVRREGGVHTPGEYMTYIGHRLQEAQNLIWTRKGEESVPPALREIAILALSALEDNRASLGLLEQHSIRELVDEWHIDGNRSITEYLLDVESIVLRYKAHRPQLRTPEASAKVAASFLEILALALACLQRHS